MKARPLHFLSDENIDHDGEVFDYIRELHSYLWRYVRAVNPNANGSLVFYVDDCIEELEENMRKRREAKL